jgi:hypothetical protein
VPLLFALDQNFPRPIVEVLVEYQAAAELVPLPSIDAALAELDDWEVLLALHHHREQWDGLITTDTSILNQPRELAVLIQTRLTLVAVREAGHNPVKATGLLFAYLPGICKRVRADRAQIWTPAAADRPHHEPWQALERVAAHRHENTSEMFEAHRLSPDELARDPLADQ